MLVMPNSCCYTRNRMMRNKRESIARLRKLTKEREIENFVKSQFEDTSLLMCYLKKLLFLCFYLTPTIIDILQMNDKYEWIRLNPFKANTVLSVDNSEYSLKVMLTPFVASVKGIAVRTSSEACLDARGRRDTPIKSSWWYGQIWYWKCVDGVTRATFHRSKDCGILKIFLE